MTCRPDWHPSYGTPIPNSYRQRVDDLRDRLGIEPYVPNLKARAVFGVVFLCGAMAAIDYWPVNFSLFGVAVWVMWPILARPREDW